MYMNKDIAEPELGSYTAPEYHGSAEIRLLRCHGHKGLTLHTLLSTMVTAFLISASSLIQSGCGRHVLWH